MIALFSHSSYRKSIVGDGKIIERSENGIIETYEPFLWEHKLDDKKRTGFPTRADPEGTKLL